MIEEAPLYNDLARGPEGGSAWWLKAADGVRIRLAVWSKAGSKGTVFLLPGRTEYIEKYGPAAGEFLARGYAMVAIDWRGQGLADRLCADPVKGHVAEFGDYQRDFDAVLDAAARFCLPRPWFVLGHSMGGAIGLRRIMGTHPFTAAAFSAPMWEIGLPKLIQPIGPALAQILRNGPLSMIYPPGFSAQSYVLRAPFLDNKLTKDAGMWAFMLNHLHELPAITLSGPSLQWVCEGILECEDLDEHPSPDLPCYCAIGSNERIIETSAVFDRMHRWPKGRLEIFEGAEHELMMESEERRRRFYDGCVACFAGASEHFHAIG
ncbi:lysophospholipase [Rhodobacter aestuarii]|uniref:Lysophospholipase n=1 Tax=Rhodobacter aestuarii TaxID=453582 RepID=A0A1N7KSV5_9RHOB|nr:alpha/beta hydrolase [Rhodobacter aestuarii]PTV95591.1 lysophospholipase [Rhodobacter aestuarii]SIS64631.1 lysophospholipase [Rhodobacter aestuarii]